MMTLISDFSTVETELDEAPKDEESKIFSVSAFLMPQKIPQLNPSHVQKDSHCSHIQ